MPLLCKILLAYLAGISLLASAVTIADKSRARRAQMAGAGSHPPDAVRPGRFGGHVRHHAVHPA